MENMEAKLREYARLLVRTGVNIKEGQRLSISAQTDIAPFVRLCVEEAYGARAGKVTVGWEDDYVSRLTYLHADDQVFDEPDVHSDEYWQGYARRGDADLRINSSDPEIFADVDQDRISREAKAQRPAKKPVMDKMRQGRLQWCVASYPTQAWAARVFPDLPEDEALYKLWEALLAACRVTGDGTAPEKWQRQQEILKKRIDTLNSFKLKSLKYKSALGTDLTIGLPEGHFWDGGFAQCEGRPYLPNIPTEEVYTSPHRLTAEGTIVASMPLYLSGTKVDGIRMRLSRGKIVDVQADTGLGALLSRMDTDEGSRYLGECALVSWDSPIRRTGILFQDTLFDENASCHFAFGNAYPMVEGAWDMDEEQRRQIGLNVSDTHVDFMVGTEDMAVTGVTAGGEEVPIMRDGVFVIG